jgi:hypothetical protein
LDSAEKFRWDIAGICFNVSWEHLEDWRLFSFVGSAEILVEDRL